MSSKPTWQYDEFKQVGTDYASQAEIEAYDESMRRLRNTQEENEHILGALELAPESTVVEIGTGTGEFAIAAAARCARVYAVDISEAALEWSRRKALERGAKNIEFKRGGFLTYEHGGKPVDAVVSQLALHHLPDYWKAVALRRVCDLLRVGGRLFLRDTVFPSDVRNRSEYFEKWISGVERVAGTELARQVEAHIRDEYSTLDWIMEGLLRSAGFSIRSAEYGKGVFASYLCVKTP